MILDANRSPRTRFSGSALPGAAIWAVASILLVVLRGPRWDEHFELAQVVLGNVPYPPEHPLAIWTHNLPNLQILLSRAIVSVFPEPEAICYFRNSLWLATLLVPVYLIARTLAKSDLAGHAAALFALFGIHLAFDAHYQMFTWPGYYSNGHVGRGLALFILWALLENRLRLAMILIGFMPAVHITQVVPVGLTGAILGTYLLTRTPSRRHVLAAVPWALPGIVVSGMLFAVAAVNPVSLPSTGPYYSPDAAEPIVRGFLSNDAHRAMPGSVIPITNANLILALVLTLCIARVVFEPKRDAYDPWRRLLLYLSVVAGIVWGAMALHVVLGTRMPAILLSWMPYRFTNHGAVLTLAVLPAILLRDRTIKAGTAAVGAALLLETIKPLFALVVGEQIYTRYLADGDVTLLALAGAAAASLQADPGSPRVRSYPFAATLAAAAGVSLFHQFAAAAILAGFAAMQIALRASALNRIPAPLLPAVAGLALFVIAVQQVRAHEVLFRTPFDGAVVDYFESVGLPNAMILARPDQRTLQARLDHPVFMDEALATGIPYVPRLAPSIQKMSRDAYGIRYEPEMGPEDISWVALWQSRTPEDWRETMAPYGIRFVISPHTVPLQLPERVAGDAESLYEIP